LVTIIGNLANPTFLTMATLQPQDNSDEPVLVTTGEAGRLALLSGERIQQLVDEGELGSFRTAKGQRLLLLTEVRAFIERRQNARSGMVKNVTD
jgi:hypothetical protein